MYNFFFKHFLRDPKSVGAIVPLSKVASKELAKDLAQPLHDRPRMILEVGAGTGNVTEVIEKHLKPNDHLDVIEIDRQCCDLLLKKFGKNSQMGVHCLSILDWRPSYKYDYIISTLPLNSFPSSMVEQILVHYQEISNEGALCRYVEYMGLETLSLVTSNKERRQAILERKELLENFHKDHLVHTNKIYSNFLPCYVYQLKLKKNYL